MITYFPVLLCFYIRIFQICNQGVESYYATVISYVKLEKKLRRFPEKKVFVARELSKGVATLTVPQRDQREIRRQVTTSQQRHKKRVQPQL